MQIKLPDYNYKGLHEFGWAVLTAVGIVIAQAMLTLDFDKIADWRVWALGVLGAAVRAAGGAILTQIGSSRG